MSFRDTLTAGTVTLTVTLPPTFIRARALLGEEWQPSYTYRIERVDYQTSTRLFLSTLTTNPRKPSQPARYVYTGCVHPRLGSLRMTSASAFPATATRVRVADRVLRALFAERAADIEAAGWQIAVNVEQELVGRF